MAYSTATSLLIILPGLPQTSTSAGYTSTVEIVDKHILRADNTINGKVSIRYDVSAFSSDVPPLLKTLSEDIASFYSFRSFYGGDNQNINEWIEKYQEALNFLDEIRDAKIDLVDENGNVIPERDTTASTVISSNTKDYQSTFDEDDVLNWKTDQDKLTTIEDNR